VVGSYYPFAIRQKQPGAFATRALGHEAVLADNAFRFLGHRHEVKKLARTTAPAAGSAPGSRARG
jgi:aminocarboxymuconate-semialdehyde decarboxylase